MHYVCFSPSFQRFTKNLSPDKIHVSTLRGEGELSGLELDEQVLTQVLDLPTWLRISKATCNRVAIKVNGVTSFTNEYIQSLTICNFKA